MTDKWPYGESTEIEVLCTIMQDKVLLSWVAPKLSPDDFNNEILGEIWHVIRSLWFTYRIVPNIRQVASELETLLKEESLFKEDIPVIKAAVKMLKNHTPPVEWTKDKIEIWLRGRDYQTFVQDSSEALARGDLKEIDKKYKKLLQGAVREEEQEDFFDRMDKIAQRSTAKRLNLISTGIKEIDYILSGGMARNEFGLVFGPDGLGKSFMLNQIGQTSVLAGLRVLHVTNELPSEEVDDRYLSGFTSIPQDEFASRLDEIKALAPQMQMHRGLLTVKYLQPGSHPDEIFTLLEKGVMDEAPYDVVLIDYLDRFKYDTKSNAQWQDLTEVCDRFSFMAKPVKDGGYNCLIVAVTHSDASAYGKQTIGAGQMGLSKMGKNKTADFILGMSGNDEDKEKGIIRMTTIKLRYRPWPKKDRAVLQQAFSRSTFIPLQLEITGDNRDK